jgi:spermidine/putrescine transport system permease protein
MKVLPRVSTSALAAALPGFVLLLVPLLLLVLRSFLVRDLLTGGSEWTLVWYGKLFENGALGAALASSLWIGAWSSLISTAIGTVAALALARGGNFKGRQVLDSLIQIPLVLPEIVMGLSLLIWFVFLNLTLGNVSVILAHVTFSVSYVILTVGARLEGFDHSLEDAARDLGATPFQVFRRVTFPLILPAIISGALMAFTLSFDDFLITFFVAGVGTDTLPLRVYSMIRFGVSPELNALSTVILGVTVLLAGLGFKKVGVR